MPTIAYSQTHTAQSPPSADIGQLPVGTGEDAELLRQQELEMLQSLDQLTDTLVEMITFFIPTWFKLEDPESVLQLLSENSEVLFCLPELRQAIGEFFPVAEPTLSVLPAGEDAQTPQLVMSVETRMTVADARKTLREFRSRWWQPNYQPCFKDITISLYFHDCEV